MISFQKVGDLAPEKQPCDMMRYDEISRIENDEIGLRYMKITSMETALLRLKIHHFLRAFPSKIEFNHK